MTTTENFEYACPSTTRARRRIANPLDRLFRKSDAPISHEHRVLRNDEALRRELRERQLERIRFSRFTIGG